MNKNFEEKLSWFNAYLRKTAYLKCLLLSTWDPINLKLETQDENDAANSVNARYDQFQAQNTTDTQSIAISSRNKLKFKTVKAQAGTETK